MTKFKFFFLLLLFACSTPCLGNSHYNNYSIKFVSSVGIDRLFITNSYQWSDTGLITFFKYRSDGVMLESNKAKFLSQNSIDFSSFEAVGSEFELDHNPARVKVCKALNERVPYFKDSVAVKDSESLLLSSTSAIPSSLQVEEKLPGVYFSISEVEEKVAVDHVINQAPMALLSALSKPCYLHFSTDVYSLFSIDSQIDVGISMFTEIQGVKYFVEFYTYQKN